MLSTRLLTLSLLLPAMLTLGVLTTNARAQSPELIPREVLFGNPERANVQISPDGSYISYLAPVDGVLNVWVAPADDIDAAEPVTEDKFRGIRRYFWAHDNEHVLYVQDTGGDEDFRLYATSVETKETRPLTSGDPILGPDGEPLRDPSTGKPLKPTVQIEMVSHRSPGEILIGLNDRDPQWHDLYAIDIASGERELVQRNDGYAGFLTDLNYEVHLAVRPRPDGGMTVLKRNGSDWTTFAEIDLQDNLSTAPLAFDKTGRIVYMRDSRDRDTAALYAVDIRTGERRLLAEDERADVNDVMLHPTERTVQAVGSTYLRQNWQFLDEGVRDAFSRLRRVSEGDISVASRTTDDSQWIVQFVLDNGPVEYWHFDRASGEGPKFLFTNRPALEDAELARMHPVVIPARDGLTLPSYYPLPPRADTDGDALPEKPTSMVLLVHGGPWARDSWGYNGIHQWLANRGHAVLSVNFRGSTGFGKSFVNAGNLEWSRAMHDDLIDAVDWAIERGIADADNIAIMGGSYGGYATLVGLTFTPEKFAAGVDIVGPSNLVTLLNSIPPYWKSFRDQLRRRVGDIDTPEGRIFLRSASPLTHVDEIVRPLLIGQGANDPRVKQAESDQIVSAMSERGIPVTYVLFPDEGHGFRRPENTLAFFAVTEAFLQTHIGGVYEPIGDDFRGSSIQVPAGAEHVPGLRAKLER